MKMLSVYLLCAALGISAAGCSSTNAVSLDEYRDGRHGGIERVVMTDGGIVEFETTTGREATYKDHEVVGYDNQTGELTHIPADKIRLVTYTEIDAAKTAIVGGGALLGAAIVGAAVLTVIGVARIMDDSH